MQKYAAGALIVGGMLFVGFMNRSRSGGLAATICTQQTQQLIADTAVSDPVFRFDPYQGDRLQGCCEGYPISVQVGMSKDKRTFGCYHQILGYVGPLQYGLPHCCGGIDPMRVLSPAAK